MGNYSNDEPVGKHIMLKKNGEIEINCYSFYKTYLKTFYIELVK